MTGEKLKFFAQSQIGHLISQNLKIIFFWLNLDYYLKTTKILLILTLNVFVKVSKSLIFLVKSFLGNFYGHLAIIYWSHWSG